MKRLTEKELRNLRNPHLIKCPYGHCLSCDISDEAIVKLKEYEDLEEKGLLLKLPCKISDTLWTNVSMRGWYFRLKDAPYRVEVVFIGLNNSEEMGNGFFNVCYEKHDHMMQFNFSDIGKTVFLTKKEAEEALRKKVE